MLKHALLVLLFSLPTLSYSGFALTALAGSQSYLGLKGMGFGYNFSGYYKFDEQVLLGVQSGQGVAGNASAIPILAAAYIRLPLGKVVMPAAIGEFGYVRADSNSGMLWRAGGVFDIRNGKHSSLLIGAEYESFSGRGGLVFRGGLLLEY